MVLALQVYASLILGPPQWLFLSSIYFKMRGTGVAVLDRHFDVKYQFIDSMFLIKI